MLCLAIHSQNFSLSRIEIEYDRLPAYHLSQESAAVMDGAAQKAHSSNAIAD